MKYSLPLLVLGSALFLGAQTLSAQSDNSPTERVEGRLDAARTARSTPDSGTSNAKPGVKQPLTAVLAKDNKGKKTATAFTQADNQIFIVWKDPTAVKGDTIKVVWVAEAVAGYPKNKKLAEHGQPMPSDGAFSSDYVLNVEKGGLPVGKYRADLYDGTKLALSLKFMISK